MISEQSIQLRDKPFLAQVWGLSAPYWKSEEKWTASILLLAVIALNYITVEIAVLYSNWNRDFFNLMQNQEWHNFWSMLGQFVLIMGVFTFVDLAEEYLRRTLRIRWRRWLTFTYLEQWLQNNRLFRHQVRKDAIDNPDQRVSNDIQQFCDRTLSMGLGLLRTVTSLFSFVVILWNLSGTLELEVAGSQWLIPGYMVWVAILYSIVGTWLTHKIAKPLTQLNFQQEKHEANFRFHLMRVREHAESVTLQRGEQAEKQRAFDLFGHIWHNWGQLTGMKLRYNAFNSGYNEVARIFPYLVAAPRLMSGALQLGDMMQTATGFYRVQEAFSWFVDSYESVAEWKAVTDRLLNFYTQLEQLEQHTVHSDAATPGWQSLTVSDPQNKQLFSSEAMELDSHAFIRGPSGSGKSTLFRSLAGLWPFRQGNISMPPSGNCMFIPQRPYLPDSSLREVLSYPHSPQKWTDDHYIRALEQANLPALKEVLDQKDRWQHRLSGGETQKIMIARALLQQPEWLFLDEALSALDQASAATLYQRLHEQLKDSRIIVISHQPEHARKNQRMFTICPEKRELQEMPA